LTRTGQAVVGLAVDGGVALSPWKLPEDRRVGFGSQLFNHPGERAAVVFGETDQLCLGWSADEELDALLIAETRWRWR
jgi:hypothetical protein